MLEFAPLVETCTLLAFTLACAALLNIPELEFSNVLIILPVLKLSIVHPVFPSGRPDSGGKKRRSPLSPNAGLS